MPIRSDDTEFLERARRLLEHYTARNSWWRRLISGKWRRHHVKDVEIILAMMRDLPNRDKEAPHLLNRKSGHDSILNYPVVNTVDLLFRLQRISNKRHFNPNGAFADILWRIKSLVLQRPTLLAQMAIDTKQGYLSPNIHSEKNGLMFAMSISTADTNAVFDALDSCDKETKVRLLQQTLVYMMGEKYYNHEWSFDIPAITGDHSNLVDFDYLQHLPKLLQTMGNLDFESKKHILLPGIFRAVQQGRTNAVATLLDALLPADIDQEQLAWVNKMLSKLTPTHYKRLMKAIQIDQISIPSKVKAPLVVARSSASQSFFPELAYRERQIIETLEELTGQQGWLIQYGRHKDFKVKLIVDSEDQPLVAQITRTLQKMVEWDVLSLNISEHDGQTCFGCSKIDSYYLSGMVKKEPKLIDEDTQAKPVPQS